MISVKKLSIFQAFFLMPILTLSIFSQNQSKISEETRARIVDPSASQAVETTFDMEKKAFVLINEIRRINGLKELVWSDEVARIAREHSQSMAMNNFFSHHSLNGAMIDERADAAGLKRWRSIGENIAYNRGYAKPTEFAVECWMKSQGHRENLLNSMWKETGIGVAIAKDGSYYFTQVFLLRR